MSSAQGVYSPQAQAKALAIILREEFGTPLAFYEAETGGLVWFDDVEGLRDQVQELPSEEVQALCREGRARVGPWQRGRFQFALPLWEGGRTVLVAAGALPSLADNPARAAAEQRRLQRWVQAVSDRLRAADQTVVSRRCADDQGAQLKQAWDVIFTLHQVLRHHLFHLHTRKRLLKTGLLVAGLGRGVEKPADEHQPEPPRHPGKKGEDPEEDEKEGDLLSDARRFLGRIIVIFFSLPDERPQHPPAVHREAGDEIEEAEDEIDPRDIGKDRLHSPCGIQGEVKESQGEEETRKRPGDRDHPLRLRMRRLAFHLGDPPRR